jgi:hypothetical protein
MLITFQHRKVLLSLIVTRVLTRMYIKLHTLFKPLTNTVDQWREIFGSEKLLEGT